ncbi:CD3072 family TudS-related putative desulfidase [Marasmitruncus massiliensis]|uniref:CD3072 family TudS-related putative desulfidase n=1 Tax=Marasmitruncus massiliensis TaxID=1944642 RepID=UPI001FA849B5|nr:CD3072 family TudS-related putative desulfidase [Marasmitruncus massiliensis]
MMENNDSRVLRKIAVVSHCILNPASKVFAPGNHQLEQEESLRKKFLYAALECGIDLLQLPCPEFTLYGSMRWGHVKEQFDNVFFRAHCRRILESVVEQLAEYAVHPERYLILGIVGIDGSPSCGVSVTCRGRWGGELESADRLEQRIASVQTVRENGVLMEELSALLNQYNLSLPIMPLDDALLERILK